MYYYILSSDTVSAHVATSRGNLLHIVVNGILCRRDVGGKYVHAHTFHRHPDDKICSRTHEREIRKGIIGFY